MRTGRALFVLPFLIASIASVAQQQQPEAIFTSAHDNITADPFDVGTGIYYREYEDLFVKDAIPINFVRTQRSRVTRFTFRRYDERPNASDVAHSEEFLDGLFPSGRC